MISVNELTKRYGPFLAVDRVSFEIARGEVVGFLGPNGAGKTTTIRVLTGYHPATSGRAVLAGHDVTTASLQVRQQIGYLPQEVPIYPDLRVIEYLRYRAALKGVPAKLRKAAVAAAMDKAGIADVARKLVGKVSHGYRQRVGLADALVANPPILILDEPTSGLDPNQRLRIKQVVRDLAADHTILFSSHILAEVQEVSSRVLIIHRGRLRADGAPERLARSGCDARLVLVAVAGTEALAAVLRQQPALRPGPIEPRGDGIVRVVCDVAADSEPLWPLGQQLAAVGIPVLELRLELPTLESYFHSITEGSDLAEEAAAAAAAAGAA
ncbi:MAG: ABC transporter ATP-binding protein [Planctomycetes bacterium]|jgi:ABC-2 type transport system ATP-binding protein|nr:ABC transporter ATP-binding protein [Planctomycetota bacterium]